MEFWFPLIHEWWQDLACGFVYGAAGVMTWHYFRQKHRNRRMRRPSVYAPYDTRHGGW